MKRILPLLIFGLIGALRAWSQQPVLFDINFNGTPPPHVSFLPPGGGKLDMNSFSAIVYLDNTPPVSGRILEREDDNSFQMIAALNIVFAAYPPSMGGGGTAYDLEQTLSLSNLQIQNLLAGKWYAEVVLDQNTYLGQFVTVPEPCSATLLICGASVVLARRRFRLAA